MVIFQTPSPPGEGRVFAPLYDFRTAGILYPVSEFQGLMSHTPRTHLQTPHSLKYDPDLPITACKDDIVRAIAGNRVLIVSGDTGSGKTTQLPKFCLEAGRGVTGRIGCTQPRRIAAMSVANRIAEEMGEEIGSTVGYKIRFTDRISPKTRIKIMTDGILLAETLSDPLLRQYDTLIVDEAHERSLNIDFILGYLRRLLDCRKNLRLIITSATLDTQRFSAAFDNAPIIAVSGRMYPVDVRYLPPAPVSKDGEDAGDVTFVELAVDAVSDIQKNGPFGDILIFMPSEQDIRETCELIEGRNLRSTTVLPLFARLSAAEQKRVFMPSAGRKIIVATNIAETSLTIPGIRYVIDTGLARISQYSPRSRTTSLMIRPISRSSADQRKGRCGRTENGVCIRLFSEDDYSGRPLYTIPEILRANLADVILRMLALKLGDITEFPFIDRPESKSIADGYELLRELEAITPATGKPGGKSTGPWVLTHDGRTMSRIPIDPRLSRMLLHAHKEDCLKDMLIIAAALSIADPRERPLEKAVEADACHRTFMEPFSDFSTLLNIWNRYHETLETEKTANRMKRFCIKHFLSFKRMREWRDIHSQLTDMMDESGLGGLPAATVESPDTVARPSKTDVFSPKYRAIHRSILSGFLSNIALQKEKNMYRAARDRDVMIFPGSTLFNRGGPWIVAAEMVETSRVFARVTARIDNRWIEDLGKNLCRYAWLHPHWERNRGEVVAMEQVSLFGLTVISERPVSYGRIKPAHASEIFIRSALIEGDIRQKFAFMAANASLMDEIRDMENRLRRRDILVSEADIETFYRDRLNGVYDIRSLQRLIRQAGNEDFLHMGKSDLMNYSPDDDLQTLFPSSIQLGNATLTCRYEFDPGCSNDGLTIPISCADVARIPQESMDWMVPGFFRAKVEALIKSLPKAYRKQLLPISRTVDIIAADLPHQTGALFTALSRFILQRFGINIPASEWSEDSLPDYLKTRIEITGPGGDVLISGRDTSIMGQPIQSAIDSATLQSIRKSVEKKDLTAWDFDDLAEHIDVTDKSGMKWTLYPGLSCQSGNDSSIDLRLFEDRIQADSAHQPAVAALYERAYAREFSFLKKSLEIPVHILPLVNRTIQKRQLEKNLYDGVVHLLFKRNIRTRAEFRCHAEETFPVMIKTAGALRAVSIQILEACQEARDRIDGLKKNLASNPVSNNFLASLRNQIDQLVPNDFLTRYPMARLKQIPRYVRAVGVRAERAWLDFEKDRAKDHELQELSERLTRQSASHLSAEKQAALENIFWSIEEYRVSCFAQELGTAIPVSRKRIEKMFQEIGQMI